MQWNGLFRQVFDQPTTRELSGIAGPRSPGLGGGV